MSNVLVTGVAGLVGSNIAKELSNHNVTGVDNLLSGYQDNIPKDIRWINQDCNYISSDYFEGIDTVVHAACTPYEGVSVFSPKFITDNTFGMSVNILKCAIQAGVKKFIFTSSMARYGYQETVPFVETMKTNPQDPYGISKVAFEDMLITLSRVYDFEYSIVVPHNIIGPGQIYTDPYRNVASIMINRMLQGKQPIIYGDGLQMRCFSDIADIVSPLKKIIETDVANHQVINVGPDSDYITINDLANKIAKILDFDLDPIYLPGRPLEVKHANCSADKARSLLGYNPTFTIDQTLQRMVNWINDRGVYPFNYHLPIEINNSLTPKSWTDRI